MIDDPIVDEIRRIRDEHAAEFNYDLDALVRDLQDQEKASGVRIYEYPPRRVAISPIADDVQAVISDVNVQR